MSAVSSLSYLRLLLHHINQGIVHAFLFLLLLLFPARPNPSVSLHWVLLGQLMEKAEPILCTLPGTDTYETLPYVNAKTSACAPFTDCQEMVLSMFDTFYCVQNRVTLIIRWCFDSWRDFSTGEVEDFVEVGVRCVGLLDFLSEGI